LGSDLLLCQSFPQMKQYLLPINLALAISVLFTALSVPAAEGIKHGEGFSVRRVLKESGTHTVAMPERRVDLTVQVSHNVSTNIIVDARSIIRGSIMSDSETGGRVVELTLNQNRISALARAAKAAPMELIAVVLDGEVYFTAHLHGPMPSGKLPIPVSATDPSGERLLAKVLAGKP
jgi:preprotein translocase subunit SecD